jgi:hypothetical protein
MNVRRYVVHEMGSLTGGCKTNIAVSLVGVYVDWSYMVILVSAWDKCKELSYVCYDLP